MHDVGFSEVASMMFDVIIEYEHARDAKKLDLTSKDLNAFSVNLLQISPKSMVRCYSVGMPRFAGHYNR